LWEIIYLYLKSYYLFLSLYHYETVICRFVGVMYCASRVGSGGEETARVSVYYGEGNSGYGGEKSVEFGDLLEFFGLGLD
jgi:hypothetical protein